MLPQWTARLWKDQPGMIGIEAAIIMVALVVVAIGFANAAISSSIHFSSEAENAVQETLDNLGVLELRGSVVVIASTTGASGVVSAIVFHVANDTGGEPIDLTPGKLIIRYTDSSQSKIFDSPPGLSVNGIGSADSDMLLETGELFEFRLTGLDSIEGVPNKLTKNIGPNTAFDLELILPNAAVLLVKRRTPDSLDAIMRLD